MTMDWTQVIIALIGLVSGVLTGGGVTMWLTRKETKEGKALENMQKVLDAKDRIIEEREERCKELKADIDKKNAKIEQLLTEKSKIRDENDDLKTNLAVTMMLKCIKLNCIDRDPPFGSIVNLAGLRDADLVKMALKEESDGKI